MIECVFFDYDGVLTTDRTGSLTTCRYISKAAGIPLERVRAAFAPHNRRLTLGLTTHEIIWAEICAALGRELPLALLIQAFDSTPANAAMFDLAHRLRSQCRVGIITDNKADRMQRLRHVQQLDRAFDPIVVSAELGCSKESRAIFDHALDSARVEANRTVFIDNDRQNIAVASAAGLHAIYFDDSTNDVGGLTSRLRTEFRLL